MCRYVVRGCLEPGSEPDELLREDPDDPPSVNGVEERPARITGRSDPVCIVDESLRLSSSRQHAARQHERFHAIPPKGRHFHWSIPDASILRQDDPTFPATQFEP